MTRRRPQLAALAIVSWLLGLAGSAGGHVVHARPTLLSLVTGSDLVAHVRVLDPHASVALEATGGRRPIVRVELREVIKGAGEPGRELRFASHGHGVAEYVAGDEALVFLLPLARSRELAVLQEAGLRWVSNQEHDSRYVLTPESRAGVLAAARGYAAAGRLPERQARVERLRGVTLALLTSGDARLGASAVRDLVAAGDLPLVTQADVPRLLAEVVHSENASIGVRIGLLAELERRQLVDAAPVWQALLRSTNRPDLLQVVRAAGRHPSPEVNATLVEMLGREDAVAEASALALGDPAHADSVPALAKALQSDQPRVRMAAIRSLGLIATPAAKDALEAAAGTHEDSATRRRAAAEVRNQTRRP
ncbi:MAG: HEAT repeat domain-containing protein [Deltaproteobacteria bacterium]|nr:HEAT repeat domain-containing protein [Deltaproteobacteria bacterium]